VNAGNQGQPILDAGGKVIEILSTRLGAATVRADADAWVTTFNENVSTFIDAADTPTAALQAAGIRETVFIVEMPSMSIVYVDHGDVTGQKPSTIKTAAAQILALLGK
jgi:hypothetical protein